MNLKRILNLLLQEIECRTADKALQVSFDEIKMATGWTPPLVMKRFRKRVVNVSSLVLPFGNGSGSEKRKRPRGLCWSAHRFLTRRTRWNRVRLDFWLLSETDEKDAIHEKGKHFLQEIVWVVLNTVWLLWKLHTFL